MNIKYDTVLIGVTYFLCMLAMISDYKILSNTIGSVTTIITLVFLFISNKDGNQKLEFYAGIYAILFLAYFIITSIPNFNPNKWGVTIMVYLMVFTPFFLYAYLYKTNDYILAKILISGFFVIWTIFLLLCFISCYNTPNLARMMASERGSYYNIINGGGYYMGYGSAVLCPYLLKVLLNGYFRSSWMRLFMIFEIILMIATILVINSYVTLIALISGIAIVLINSFTQLSNSKFISYTLVAIGLLVIYFNTAQILGYLIDNTENTFWNRRLVETYESAIEGDNSVHVNERERVYQISIDGFSRSPIIGNGYKNGNAVEEKGTNNIGYHSTILDSLSQFGIIGCIPLFLFLAYPWRNAKARGDDWEFYIPFFVMAYLNPVLKSYHVMVILFLIIPCMSMIKRVEN